MMNDRMKTIYIAGPMKGDPDYRTKFNAAESYLSLKGWTVLNPACLPEGLRPGSYMPICLAMVEAADALVIFRDVNEYSGAQLEKAYAAYQKKPVYIGLESVPVLQDD